MAKGPIRVTIWNEFRHEKRNERVAKIYPDGIHGALGAHLGAQAGIEVRTATLDEPEHGLTDEVLGATDVLVWWGHSAHKEVRDEIVERVQQRVIGGMGYIALHSSHKSKLFMKLMGTTGRLKWRQVAERERIWVVEPGHPIAAGLPEHFELEHEEMYGERFDIPAPDTLVFLSWFQGGEVFRSGCCWQRGDGKIFYLRPGHETFPTYRDPHVLQVITNAVRWAAPAVATEPTWGKVEPLEAI